jgi:hypothetical protein
MTDRLASLARAALLAFALLAAAAGRAGDSDVRVSGSAYVDGWIVPEPDVSSRVPDGITFGGSLKIGVDVHDDLAFSAKACISCHGIEPEHVVLDYTPKPWFNVQFGRLAVPFGEYSERVDPSGHKTASAPLIYDMGRMAFGERSAFNLGVLPLPYTDTGVLVYGTFWLGGKIQVWYGGYGVAGLKGANDVDWISMRAPPYSDNNRVPSGGGRIVLAYSSDGESFIGDAHVGGSFTAGRYDRAAQLEYLIWGADAALRLGPFTLRGEYASRKTDVDPAASGYRFELVDDYFRKEGFYGELEHPLGPWLSAVYRYDELHRVGVPLPGATAALSTDSKIVRYTGGLVVTPAQAIYVKLSWERWEPTDFPTFDSYHAGLGGAF